MLKDHALKLTPGDFGMQRDLLVALATAVDELTAKVKTLSETPPRTGDGGANDEV